MTPTWTEWAEALLLPLMSWQERLRRTRHPGQKAQIALVLQAIEEAFERHPCTRQLTPELLADLYLGRIARWNDPKLAELNREVRLPNLPVAPVYRGDASGTT